ncbi:MAG: PorT family protein [Bacteroidia bacterium]|nr:MAG: PorT family protein [Bacteroidia bacterium]
MKKTAAFLVLLFLSAPLLADNDFGFRFGLKASPNISWFRTETRGYHNSGADLGFSYGLIVDYEFAEYYALTTGLNILRTGGTLKYNYLIPDGTFEGEMTEKRRDHRLRYVEIPMALKLSTSEMGYITYYGQFGLGLGFRIHARGNDRVPLPDGSSLRTSDVDISDNTRFLSAALIIGAGVEYNLGGRTSMLGGLTFKNGFSNVLDTRNPAVATRPSALNNHIEITLGVMF